MLTCNKINEFLALLNLKPVAKTTLISQYVCQYISAHFLLEFPSFSKKRQVLILLRFVGLAEPQFRQVSSNVHKNVTAKRQLIMRFVQQGYKLHEF